jgi:hypothetical protein
MALESLAHCPSKKPLEIPISLLSGRSQTLLRVYIKPTQQSSFCIIQNQLICNIITGVIDLPYSQVMPILKVRGIGNHKEKEVGT